MGVTIHYDGKIKSKSILPDLVAELEDIAIGMKWEYHVFSEKFPDGQLDGTNFDGELYGICFSPDKCEPIWLSFLSNGRLAGPHFIASCNGEQLCDDNESLYGAFTKTQFAGVNIHKTIIELFRYVNGKGYFEEFSVIDEGEYWEKSDENLLKSKFDLVDLGIDNFALALETIPIEVGEETIDYCERLLELIHKHMYKNEGNNSE